PVVAERALPHTTIGLPRERPRPVRRRELPLVDDAERTGRHAVAAAVAHVLLDHDRPELGAEERAGRTDVETGGVRAVLADVGAHQPAQRFVDLRRLAFKLQRRAL